MVDFIIESGVEIIGTAAQIRVTDVTAAPDVTYDITIPAGVYLFSVDTTTKNDIIQTVKASITAAIGAWGGDLAINTDGHRIDWDGNTDYTLRLLDTDDAEPLALLLGLYGDSYDWDYYQTHDAPATWRHTAAQCWFGCGYDHPQYSAQGFPTNDSDHRVTEAGVAAHLARSKKRVLDLTFNAAPGAILRDDSNDAAAAMTDGLTSPSMWRVLDPENVAPIIHIYATSRFNNFYYLQKPLMPEDCDRLFAGWKNYYNINMTLAVADV